MTACPCPDVAPPYADPITCGCCGHPIELTCAGNCGHKHIRAAFKAATAKPKLERIPPGKPAPWTCPRCTNEMPKRLGRKPIACETCLTPKEIERRDKQRAANDRNRAAKAASIGDPS